MVVFGSVSSLEQLHMDLIIQLEEKTSGHVSEKHPDNRNQHFQAKDRW